MSFIIEKNIKVHKAYLDYNIVVEQGSEILKLKYDIVSIESISAGNGVANYTVSINGSVGQQRQIAFEYSIGDDLFKTAEYVLESQERAIS